LSHAPSVREHTPVSNLLRLSEPVSLALHAAALLARQPDQRIANARLAATLQVSEHHLAKVMQRLARAGLVSSTRGPQGGFQLERAADRVALIELFEAVDGPVGEAKCLLSQQICDGRDCLVGELVHDVHEHVRRYLAETTLARLAEGFTFVELDSEGGAGSTGP